MQKSIVKMVINLNVSEAKYRRWAKLKRYDKILKCIDRVLKREMLADIFDKYDITHNQSSFPQQKYITYRSSDIENIIIDTDRIDECANKLCNIGIDAHIEIEPYTRILKNYPQHRLANNCSDDSLYKLKITLNHYISPDKISHIVGYLSTPVSKCYLFDDDQDKGITDTIIEYSGIGVNSFTVVYHISDDWKSVDPETLISLQEMRIYNDFGVKIISVEQI